MCKQYLWTCHHCHNEQDIIRRCPRRPRCTSPTPTAEAIPADAPEVLQCCYCLATSRSRGPVVFSPDSYHHNHPQHPPGNCNTNGTTAMDWLPTQTSGRPFYPPAPTPPDMMMPEIAFTPTGPAARMTSQAQTQDQAHRHHPPYYSHLPGSEVPHIKVDDPNGIDITCTAFETEVEQPRLLCDDARIRSIQATRKQIFRDRCTDQNGKERNAAWESAWKELRTALSGGGG